jgi:hypothetical protein
LKTVALAVAGRADECIEKYKQAGESLTSGIVTFAIFLVLAVVAYIPFGPWPAAIDLVFGIIFSAPQVIKGLRKHRAADRILETDDRALVTAGSNVEPMRPVRTLDSIEPPSEAGSVTEHTTFELEPPDSRRG